MISRKCLKNLSNQTFEWTSQSTNDFTRTPPVMPCCPQITFTGVNQVIVQNQCGRLEITPNLMNWNENNQYFFTMSWFLPAIKTTGVSGKDKKKKKVNDTAPSRKSKFWSIPYWMTIFQLPVADIVCFIVGEQGASHQGATGSKNLQPIIRYMWFPGTLFFDFLERLLQQCVVDVAYTPFYTHLKTKTKHFTFI